MRGTQSSAAQQAERFCRPHRIGLFGHRGVGKTTLLTMLYREAVAGRLPDLRLAAANARTADYLADKIIRLEGGETLPATLAETELALHLYHKEVRLELLLKDYQGEHVELGRDGSIQAFLRECDAVLFCLDLATLPDGPARLHRQQEIDQLVEDYLAGAPRRVLDRPMAIVLTKSDLVETAGEDLDDLARTHFGMTRHALHSHCPANGLFAVSSLGKPGVVLQPTNLAEPLAWLATALQARDEARLEQIWSSANRHPSLLASCVACFANRYPGAPARQGYQDRLRDLRRQRRRRWTLAGAATAACLLVGLWSYDALGHQAAIRFEESHPASPDLSLQRWQQFQKWHPTRHLLGAVSADTEAKHVQELSTASVELERDARLADLRRRAGNPDADPETVWKQFQGFRDSYPEVNVTGDLAQVRLALKARRDQQVDQKARQAFDELQRGAERTGNLKELVACADRFLREFPGSALDSQARQWRTVCLHRLDEQDIQEARDYSARSPFNFQTRRELYQRYLERHPGSGAFTGEATAALRTIALDWDKHDFRKLRDQFTRHPGDTAELVAHCQRYLAVHPQGKFTAAARDLLRWSERVTERGAYQVVLRDGHFKKDVACFFSRGPKLSVELEVNGVRHGPSTIIYNQYDPHWNFEYPRPIRWKLGDAVRIRVTEHSWRNSVVMDVTLDGPLAMKSLAGEVWSDGNRLTFASNFSMPRLPRID